MDVGNGGRATSLNNGNSHPFLALESIPHLGLLHTHTHTHTHTNMIKDGTSLVAQMVKKSAEMQETQVVSLGWKIPWRRKWLSTPVFLPGDFHGLRSLAGYSS